MRRTRLFQIFRLALTRSSKKKSEYIRKHNIFALFGNDSRYCPYWLPIYPKLIRIHNNVYIHKSVRLVPHDMINRFLK